MRGVAGLGLVGLGLVWIGLVGLVFVGGRWASGDDGSCGAGVMVGGAADGDAADGVVADVFGVVGVDEVEGWAAEGGEGGYERCSGGGGVDVEEGRGDVTGVVDGPGEGDGAAFAVEERREDGCGDLRGADGFGGGEDVEGDVAASGYADVLGVVSDGSPGAVGLLVLGGGAGAAEVFDAEILDVGTEVGESPGDVLIAADDDEGDAGEGEAGDVELGAGGGCGGVEAGFVPGVWNAEGEVRVVGEESAAGCGAGGGYGPVVGAGAAAFALLVGELVGQVEDVGGGGGRLVGRDGRERSGFARYPR